jgi:membrane-associated phospholipid phosphatase
VKNIFSKLTDIKIIVLAILVIIFSFQSSLALPSDSTETKESISVKIAHDTKHFLNTGIGLATAPLEFTVKDWTIAGIVTFGTISLFTIDKDVQNFALNNQNRLNDKIFNFDTYYGNAYMAAMTAGIYGVGFISGNNGIRKLGLNSIEAFLYSGLITTILKVSIGRRRPYAGESNLFFKPFQFTDNDFQSLPSGHATVSFAVSTVMADYVDNIFWKIFWFGAASMTSFSRIYNNQHWFSDIFLGGAIGYFVGYYVINQNTHTDSNTLGSSIIPYIGINRIGIILTL